MSKRKIADLGESPNSKIAKILIQLSDYEKNKNRNTYKYNAYRKAAAVIQKYDKEISSGKEAKALDGVGEKIAKKIDEIIKTGSLKKLCEVQNDEEAVALNELTKISGIGPVLAHKLYSTGIKSIESLRTSSYKLNHQQKIGLKHFDDFELRIPRVEMEAMEQLVNTEIKAVDDKILSCVCGSYRRGAPTSGDIDFLITHPEFLTTNRKSKKRNNYLSSIIDRLVKIGFVTDSLSHGELKFMGVCKLSTSAHYRRIDFQLIPYDQYYCALVHFTGSDMYNRHIRTEALKLGFTLNEYSLRPIGSTGVLGEPLPVNCEQDIFDYLGIDYLEPTKRLF